MRHYESVGSGRGAMCFYECGKTQAGDFEADPVWEVMSVRAPFLLREIAREEGFEWSPVFGCEHRCVNRKWIAFGRTKAEALEHQRRFVEEHSWQCMRDNAIMDWLNGVEVA